MRKSNLFAGFVTAIMLLATACEKEQEPVKEPSDVPEPKTPQLTLTKGNISEYSFDFTLESSDAEIVKWLCIEKDSRSVNAAFVLTNGTEAEADATVSITVENLEAETAYTVYAAASNGDESILSLPLDITTLQYVPPVNIIEIDGTQASCEPILSGDLMNFYITFTDAEGNAFKADVYTEADQTWLPSGTYTLGEIAAGNISIDYTAFADASDPYTLTKFVNGAITFEATPDETTQDITYAVSGKFAMANGDTVKVAYDGPIAGISLPEPDSDKSVFRFEVLPSLSQPEFFYRNDAEPGWYPIKFIGKGWSELKVIIVVDPALCDDGKAPIPAGEYSIADGSVHEDSDITMYTAPRLSGNFETCTVSVAVNGDEYTFELNASGMLGEEEKTDVVLNYTGKVKDNRYW